MKHLLRLSLLLSLFCASPAFTALPIVDTVIFTRHGEKPFKLEPATDDASREQGLMARDSLKPNDGMLFVFPAPQDYKFWMKNTRISLDMLFVDEDHTIVFIAPKTKPRTLALHSSGKPVIAVIELDGGRAAREGIAVGDKVRYVLPEGVLVD